VDFIFTTACGDARDTAGLMFKASSQKKTLKSVMEVSLF
jgi:hypothetical protein